MSAPPPAVAKATAGRSDPYLRQVRHHLSAFAAGRASVTGGEVHSRYQILPAVAWAVGFNQQACTRLFRLCGDLGSMLLLCRTTQRKADWMWGPGQPNRS